MYRLLIVSIWNFFLSLQSERIILKESFHYPDGPPPVIYWSEGCQGIIRNGKLFINADTNGFRASSVWLDKELEGDMRIEFDVTVLSSLDDANNINLFFMYCDSSGKPLRQTARLREDGLYERYHSLHGYIITNVTNGDQSAIRYRVRKNPGFLMMEEAHASRKNRKKKSI